MDDIIEVGSPLSPPPHPEAMIEQFVTPVKPYFCARVDIYNLLQFLALRYHTRPL